MSGNNNDPTADVCHESRGCLPECAPLANPYVPFQQQDDQTYQAGIGMVRGTLYPGLDLPFMGMVNQKEKNDTLLQQLQTLNFAVVELGEYLDTHPEDTDAAALFDQYVAKYAEALQRYEKHCRPMTQMATILSGKYNWTDGPWPWEYSANQEV